MRLRPQEIASVLRAEPQVYEVIVHASRTTAPSVRVVGDRSRFRPFPADFVDTRFSA